MRIVGGELRGRRLAAPPRRSSAVRPTSDRAREAIFSILGDVTGAAVLDLFAGTGALAFEALSRGAATAVLVDGDVGLARRNAAALGVEDRCRIVRADALRFLRAGEERFGLVFCDPPYRLADRLGPELDQLIPACLAEGGRLILESAAREPLELSLPVIRRRRYGEALVTVHGAPA